MSYRKNVYKIGKTAEKGGEILGIIGALLAVVGGFAHLINKVTKKKK